MENANIFCVLTALQEHKLSQSFRANNFCRLILALKTEDYNSWTKALSV